MNRSNLLLLRALLLCCLSLPLSGKAQNVAIGAHHAADSATVATVNVGLVAKVDTLSGFQLGLLRAHTVHRMQGVNLGGLTALSMGHANGLQSASLMNSCTGTLQGVQAGGVLSAAGTLRGLQIGGFSTISAHPFSGVQISGISNIAMGVKGGLQLAGAMNISSSAMRGVQVAAYNYADSLNGSQIGLVNVALAHPRGWQIGLVNYTRDKVAHKVGLVNVNPRTLIDVMAFAGTSSKANVALRFRNRSTYNLLGFGTHYMGLDKRFSGALFYRIGQYFSLSPRFSLSGDVGFFHIETFQHNTTSKPERLYSLQARLNADYQFAEHVGAFVSVGYGDTRYYAHARRYRQRALVEAGLTFRYRRNPTPWSAPNLYEGVFSAPSSSPLAPSPKARPWRAAAEATGINLLVHSFDRFVMNEDFAQVNLHTIHHNFQHGFVWDNDQFSTNLFAHPYHGNLYYNAARSNGLTFWQSAPYALGGSLMWEFCGEIEPPAINDLIATTMGGICIGEVTHRISNLVLNDRARGFRRFLREFAATAICPMKGLNRMISGEAWHVKDDHYLYHDAQQFPFDFSLSVGNRYLADDGALFRGEHNPYLNLYLEYGDPLDRLEQNKPYDFFSIDATVGLSSNQPLINGLHILGRLWSLPLHADNGVKASFGIYQHFNYYDSKPVKDGTRLTPYRISEAGAVGPGVVFAFPQVGALSRLEQRLFVSGILLGGTKSDYYNVIDRDYNMGSGYSVKSKTHMELRNFGRFILHANYFALYTWKGYERKDLANVNPLYLNAQGDKGNAKLLVLNPMWEIDFRGALSAALSASYYVRDTHYKYYPDVHARTFELRAGLTYHF